MDETVYHVGAEPENYTIELNTTSNDVQEQVIKVRTSIIKHTDDGSTQIETPEEGAEFQVYLKRSVTEGHFGDIKENENFRRFNHCSSEKVYEEFMLYAIGRNINKYHRFIHNQIQKFEGKQAQNIA